MDKKASSLTHHTSSRLYADRAAYSNQTQSCFCASVPVIFFKENACFTAKERRDETHPWSRKTQHRNNKVWHKWCGIYLLGTWQHLLKWVFKTSWINFNDYVYAYSMYVYVCACVYAYSKLHKSCKNILLGFICSQGPLKSGVHSFSHFHTSIQWNIIPDT